MWYVSIYAPVTLFSLKSSQATNMAAKSLLLPSPYSIKMAMLDKLITFWSLEEAKKRFSKIKKMQFQFQLPEKIIVNNCFVKILKQPKKPTFQQSICFREYIFFSDNIKIAIKLDDEMDTEWIEKTMKRINYFGKRGCFFQFIQSEIVEKLPLNFSGYFLQENAANGILVKMDDFGSKVTFDKVNNFTSAQTIREEKIYCLPYYQTYSTKDYSVFQYIDEGD